MSLPVIALVGRPNVGKSTLFNALSRSRQALVYDTPGVTRDRQYSEITYQDRRLIIVDTGGLSDETLPLTVLVKRMTEKTVLEADLVLFIVASNEGLTALDQDIAIWLRKTGKPVRIIINKADPGSTRDISEFYRLGLGQPLLVSASHRSGLDDLLEMCCALLPAAETPETLAEPGIKIALIGKPNVGKSTLTNRLLGEERVIVADVPGTTRDSIYIPFVRHGEPYVLIDTAGIRRKAKVFETVEKFSIVKTLAAIDECDVVVLLIDAQEGVTEQDLHLLDLILTKGRALVIAVNKWDGLDQDYKATVKEALARRLHFVADFTELYFISALHGTSVGLLYRAIKRAYQSAYKKLSTPKLTQVLLQAQLEHNPPMISRRRIRLKYAHSGGQNPQRIVIHGNQLSALPQSYQRYLVHAFCKAFKLVGVPVKLELKEADNPYQAAASTQR